MTLLGILGAILSLLAFQIAMIDRNRVRITVFILAFLTHIGTTVLYYVWAQTTNTDATLYYFDPYRFYGEGFYLGTGFVIYFVQYLREIFGGTYLDYFMLFQAFGFWGIALMMRIVEEMHVELETPQSPWTYLLFFLPSIHFWTSAIGKDAPLLMAISLALWSSMQLRRRFIAFSIAILIMVAFRPYVALVALAALAASVFIDRRTSFAVKIGLVAATIIALIPVLTTVQTLFSVDATSTESVTQFIQERSEINANVEGGSSIGDASIPVRLFSLLFRPMFIDAEGLFAYIASVENVLLLLVVAMILLSLGHTARLVRKVFFLQFAVLSFLGLLVMLTLTYYNIGLGLRQKVMLMPAILTLFIALRIVKHVRTERAELSYAE